MDATSATGRENAGQQAIPQLDAGRIARARGERPSVWAAIKNGLEQERIVLIGALLLFAAFSYFLEGFLTTGNLAVLARNVSVLGVLAVGAAIVVIGRGLDISQVVILTVSSAWVASLIVEGWSLPAAAAAGLAFALACGVVNGVLVAFADMPPVFVTLGTSIFIGGLARVALFDRSLYGIPADQTDLIFLGQGSVYGIPMPVIIFAACALAAHIFLTRFVWGRFIYAQGDNHGAARLTGIPVRKLVVFEYAVSAFMAFIGGMVLSGSIASVNMSLSNSTLIFDILMVVVVGGISLVGGRGGVGSVLAGVALIGILLNGMVLMNVPSDVQDIIKGLVLLGAIVIDVRLHPRDEETARQGDL